MQKIITAYKMRGLITDRMAALPLTAESSKAIKSTVRIAMKTAQQETLAVSSTAEDSKTWCYSSLLGAACMPFAIIRIPMKHPLT